jgi:hypothetical protein
MFYIMQNVHSFVKYYRCHSRDNDTENKYINMHIIIRLNFFINIHQPYQ